MIRKFRFAIDRYVFGGYDGPMRYDPAMPEDIRIPTATRVSEAVIPCPVERAIHAIGGKWKLLVLRSLLLNGPQGYNGLLATVNGISSKELTRNLHELMALALVERGVGTASRIVPYALTDKGTGLMPIFGALLEWGDKALPLRSD